MMFVIAAILVLLAILIVWLGKPWIAAYGVPPTRRATLTPEEISAGASRISVALAGALILLAITVAMLGELTKVHPG